MSRIKPYTTNQETWNHILQKNVRIPMNQREYSWTSENISRFLDDIFNKFIVHNEIFENIFKKNYNVKYITSIEYPNFNLNEELYYFKINNNSLNMFLIGFASNIKLPNYAFRILDKLNDLGIDTTLYLFYNE